MANIALWGIWQTEQLQVQPWILQDVKPITDVYGNTWIPHSFLKESDTSDNEESLKGKDEDHSTQEYEEETSHAQADAEKTQNTVEVETPLPPANVEGRVTLHQSLPIPQQKTANLLDPGAMVLVTQEWL